MVHRRTVLKGASAAGAAGLLVKTARAATTLDATSTGEMPLSADEFSLIAAMAEGIIPATDTPGAIGAKVPEFFQVIFNDWFLPEQQIAFRSSLKGYDQDARERFGKKFLACSGSEQNQLLLIWDERGLDSSIRPPHPFSEFKRLAVHGFYTSEVGQNQELKTSMDAAQDDPNGPVMYGLAAMF